MTNKSEPKTREPEEVQAEEVFVKVKPHLRDLQGGERVIQLWEECKAKKQMGPFCPKKHREKMIDFAGNALHALCEGLDPVAPKSPPPPKPEWLVRQQSRDTKGWFKRQLFHNGWSVDDLETLSRVELKNCYYSGWSLDSVKAHRAKAEAELQKRKARWPNRYS